MLIFATVSKLAATFHEEGANSSTASIIPLSVSVVHIVRECDVYPVKAAKFGSSADIGATYD